MPMPENRVSPPNAASNSGGTGTRDVLVILDGEVHFLWWFIQGSIMNPDTWKRLMSGGGFCERHAWVHLSVEMAFREDYLLGPAILYSGLIEQSLHAFRHPRFVPRRLTTSGPCLLCDMSLEHASGGYAPEWRLARGRDMGALRAFAASLEPLWRSHICGACAGNKASACRCRRHLLADLRAGRRTHLDAQRATLEDLAAHLEAYEHSFTFGGNPASDADRGAFIAAVGWCSGWRPLLALLA
jgi:hypothetical protein